MKIILPYFKTKALYLVIANLITPSEVTYPPFWSEEPFSEDYNKVLDIDSFNLELSKLPFGFIE